MENKHILILGSGSVGKRHAQNLTKLGCKISCYDPRKDRVEELKKEIEIINSTTDENAAFGFNNLDGVVVASPTAFHSDQVIKALKSNLPVLLEKPPSKFINETKEMFKVQNNTNVPVLLGYTWRWWPPLKELKEILEKSIIGKILHVQFHMSAHLADWHPWERYNEFFMASKEQGGGALLDESHWIDLMLWLFGKPQALFGQIEKNSSLDIETDDNVDVIINYNDGKRVTIHLDLYGRPHEKFIRFVGESGTILWSANPNRIGISKKMDQDWEYINYNCERNEMFSNVASEFISVLNGSPVKTCNLQDGINVMQIIEAIRESNDTKRIITL